MKTQLLPAAPLPGLHPGSEERDLSVSRHSWLSTFLTVDVRWLAASSSYCLVLPALMMYLDLWAQINPFLIRLPLYEYFCNSDKNNKNYKRKRTKERREKRKSQDSFPDSCKSLIGSVCFHPRRSSSFLPANAICKYFTLYSVPLINTLNSRASACSCPRKSGSKRA